MIRLRAEQPTIRSILSILIAFAVLALCRRVSAEPVTREQALRVASGFTKALDVQMRNNRAAAALTIPRETVVAGPTIADVKEIKDKQGKTCAFVVARLPQGYVILSADTDIRPVIAYSAHGQFPFAEDKDNFLLHLVLGDTSAKVRKELGMLAPAMVASSQSKNHSRWAALLAGNATHLATTSSGNQWPSDRDGWITTAWSQRGIYGQFCPNDPAPNPKSTAIRCPSGCTATAMSQILNYWQYPKRLRFTLAGDSYDAGKHAAIAMPDDSALRGFPSFVTLNGQLDAIAYDGNADEIGYLCFGAGVKLCMKYGNDGSAAWRPETYVDRLGYGSASKCYGWTDENKNRVIANMKSGWPVQIAMTGTDSKGKSVGHSVIIDGYRDTDDPHFHINYGWGGSNDAWYNPPDVNNYNHFSCMIYDICPNQGWSQILADSANTSHAPYAVPAEAKMKWHVTTDDLHSFSGMVVGKGGNIYVGNANRFVGGTSSVWVISPTGVLVSIPIPRVDSGSLGYPAQSRDGNVFFPTDDGQVYRIDPDSQDAALIFTDPDNHQLCNIKITENGQLYTATWSRLYCLYQSGNVKWSYALPSTGMFLRKAAAVDASRNRAFFPWYDSSSKTSHLAMLDTANGSLLGEQVFTGVTLAGWSIGTPSVGTDGTVYVGNQSRLYALTPQAGGFSVKWSKVLGVNAGVTDAPVVGDNGSLYVTYYTDNTHQVVAALDQASSALRWEIPFQLGDNEGTVVLHHGEVDIGSILERGLVPADPFFRHAVFVGMWNTQGRVSNIGSPSQALNVIRIGESKGARDKSLRFKHREGTHLCAPLIWSHVLAPDGSVRHAMSAHNYNHPYSTGQEPVSRSRLRPLLTD